MRRLNKEYNLNVCNHMVVKYGSVNRDNPQVVYITAKCWVTAPDTEKDYKAIIRNIEHKVRKNIQIFFTDGIDFQKKYILDFDVNTDSMNNSKKFLSLGIYLRQNDNAMKKLKDVGNFIYNKTSSVINSLVYSLHENGFLVDKTKKS